MIWATVSFRSSFCWLYRASPSSTAKNIINLISVLTIWWCPCVESSFVLLKTVLAMISAFSSQNSVSLHPASFCTPRPNLPVILGISWLPTFAVQSPSDKKDIFLLLKCISFQHTSNRPVSNSIFHTYPCFFFFFNKKALSHLRH